MKSSITIALTCVTASILIAPHARAQCPNGTTDPRTLLVGSWTFVMRGNAPKTPPKHYTAAGQFTASIGPILNNPAVTVGRLAIVQSSSDGARQEVDVGSFQVFADCSGGTLTFNLSQRFLQFDFFFDESFGEIRFVSTTSGVSIVGTAEKQAPALPPQACSGQGLIGIDPVNNIGYVPIYTLDGSTPKNAQLAVVDLTVGAVTPVIKTLSLVGASRAIALAYNPNNKTMLAEAETFGPAFGVEVVEIDTTTQSVKNVVPAPGLSGTFFGGILEDSVRNKAFVAGTSQIGILDTSVSPPVWDPTSVVSTNNTDSLSLNQNTHILFISADGSNQIIDTTTTPLVPMSFNSSFGITDGNAFDVATNILVLSQEVGADQVWAFNFATLTTSPLPATASFVLCPAVCPGGGTSCLSEATPIAEGPGGQTVINCTTHQAVIADEFGQNLKLVQLPTAPVAGPLDNNGRPGSGIPADPASAFTLSETVIPKGLVGGTLTQLGMVGDPNSLTIDPAHNFVYALADTTTSFHSWTPGATTPLFLIRVDLSAPVPGASPLGGVNGTTFWTPASPPTAAIRMP